MSEIVLLDGTSSPFDRERLRSSLSARLDQQTLNLVVNRVEARLPVDNNARVDVTRLGAEVGTALLEINRELPVKVRPEASALVDLRAAVARRRGRGMLASVGIELPAMPPSEGRSTFYTALRDSLAERGDLIVDGETPADPDDGETPPDEPPVLHGEPVVITGSVQASMRAISWLWDTTVPGNPFGTDGPKRVPKTWPGDKLRQCRQWHGIDLSCNVKDGAFVRDTLLVSTPAYIGVTSTCGILGKATTTDRHITEPVWGRDEDGEYVEVKSLLGSRLGAFIPDIDVGQPSVLPLKGAGIGVLVQHLIEELIEQIAEEGYIGYDSTVAKIYSYIVLRLYANGTVISGFNSLKGGNGFQTTEEILADGLSHSFMPEHHIYLDGDYLTGITPKSSDGYPETVQWIDSWRPYDVMAFFGLSAALKDWCKTVPLEEKKKIAEAFKKAHPDVFVGTSFG
ncbi:MAG: hypothetical protein ETSY1_20960 [Candidatus Entotheonella factor]|uniref:Uncharacterized protein n=1 Tax=Entotheonella factor TaxID=1429438 RepID=W4LJK6_ENTF1|nr:hypothetical protein [Candidatus Entotheonella palauensis]ETW97875.1 MAG: hypothetical protein ETSY1_20960 [Candidatus Entotheonella factor]